MRSKKLIAFDMYDTFVHMPKGPNPYRNAFAQLGMQNFFVKQLAEILQTTDKDIQDIIPKSFIQNKNIDEIVFNLQSTIQHQQYSISLYEDFLSTIELLKQKGYHAAVVSNLSKPYSYPLTHLVPKGIFDYESLSYEVGVKKPNRKIFDHLKHISGYSSDDIVMVGDSLKSDVQGAKNANIDAIHIDRSSNGIIYHKDYISISSLQQLLDVLM